MHSFTWLSSGSVTGRLISGLERLRQRLLFQRPVIRWAIVAGTLAVLTCLGYLATTSLSTRAVRVYLGSGRSYSWDDVNKISRALDHQRVAYHVDEDRRVSVSNDQREQAEAAIAKLDLGSRPPGEIRDQSLAASPWEPLRDREIRAHRETEKILEAMIAELHGVVGCFVRLDQPKPRYALQPTARPSAFVRLETDGDRQLPFQTVQSITTILRGYEPGLSAEAITVVDRKGFKYLDAGNPALSVLSHNRAREEELSQEILNLLDWIKGVRVSVQLPSTEADDSQPSSTQAEPRRAVAADGPGTSPLPPGNEKMSRAPVAALNRPLGAVDAVAPLAPPPPSAATAHQHIPRGGRVWVKVPRSYYYQISRLPGHREPSVEEMQKYVIKTQDLIKTGLSQVVPMTGQGCWAAVIDMIDDEIPSEPPAVLSTSHDPRGIPLNWAMTGALGVLAAALILVGSWIFSARRPALRLETAPRGVRYHRGSSLIQGPSERVREFVRRSPDSAVSVLERWTRQEGDRT